MRWADLDLLGHVNNVVYVDYLQEARVDMLRQPRAAGNEPSRPRLAEGVVVVRHEVTYLRPLTFSFEPVQIECWVTEIRAASFTIAYEIFHEPPAAGAGVYAAGDDRAHAVRLRRRAATPDHRPRRRARSRFLEPADAAPRAEARRCRAEPGHYPVHVRFSDVDVYGHVNNVKYFEYFQEARILLTSRLWRDVRAEAPRATSWSRRPTSTTSVPILFRPEPYDAGPGVTHVGTRSMTIESEIRDGDTLLSRARVVIVFFDPRRPAGPPSRRRPTANGWSRRSPADVRGARRHPAC